jgi:AcrR family transcriptional regulator
MAATDPHHDNHRQDNHHHDNYHHGDLPNALRGAAADLLTERGAAGFSLREVARRAGVSHAAPAHHYGSIEGLLTAVAIEGFDHLRAAFADAAALSTDPIDRLRRQGRAYVEASQTHPGHCAVVFRDDLVDPDDPRYSEAGFSAYAELIATIETIREQYNPDLDVDVAAKLCWSAMQGLVVLYSNMSRMAANTGTTIGQMGDIADQFCAVMAAGLIAR